MKKLLSLFVLFTAMTAQISTYAQGSAFTYQGRQFQVRLIHYKGSQDSPFADGTSTSVDAMVKNQTNGKELFYSLLVPDMIERYGFYEGNGLRYRVEPSAVLEVFPYLKAMAKKK